MTKTVPDVPKQYNRLADQRFLRLANDGDKLFPVIKELGCEKIVFEGQLVKITVEMRKNPNQLKV